MVRLDSDGAKLGQSFLAVWIPAVEGILYCSVVGVGRMVAQLRKKTICINMGKQWKYRADFNVRKSWSQYIRKAKLLVVKKLHVLGLLPR